MSKEDKIENPDPKMPPPPPPEPKRKLKLERSESRSLASHGFSKDQLSASMLYPKNSHKRRALHHNEKPGEDNKPVYKSS